MTELQLDVLKILWHKREATVGEIQRELRPSHKLAATTVSTILARMSKRGDISVRRDGRQFFYSARISESDIAARKLAEVADLLYSGSAAAAISHLLDSTQLEEKELRALRKQIEEKKAATNKAARK